MVVWLAFQLSSLMKRKRPTSGSLCAHWRSCISLYIVLAPAVFHPHQVILLSTHSLLPLLLSPLCSTQAQSPSPLLYHLWSSGKHLDELLQFTKPTELFSVCGRVSLRKESQINLQIQQHEEKPGWKDNFFFCSRRHLDCFSPWYCCKGSSSGCLGGEGVSPPFGQVTFHLDDFTPAHWPYSDPFNKISRWGRRQHAFFRYLSLNKCQTRAWILLPNCGKGQTLFHRR